MIDSRLIAPQAAPQALAGGARFRCPNCDGFFGLRASCATCGQVDGLPVGMCVASPLRRLGAVLFDVTLAAGTLGLGWLVWFALTARQGQTPGKRLAGIRVVALSTGQMASWPLVLVRELLVKPLVVAATLGLGGAWLLHDSGRQNPYDKLLRSVPIRTT